jgi:hypothetical protein
MPDDVLDHHDRIVHHEADRDHQRQQGEVVERVAEDVHHHRRAGQRQRHRSAAISVGASRRRNSAITSTTIARLISSVACTSCSDARMVGVPSKYGVSVVPGCRKPRSRHSPP